jgi:hypothetical protein
MNSGNTEIVNYIFKVLNVKKISLNCGIRRDIVNDVVQDIAEILLKQSNDKLNHMLLNNYYRGFIIRILLNIKYYKGSNYYKNYITHEYKLLPTKELNEIEIPYEELEDKLYDDSLIENKKELYNKFIHTYENESDYLSKTIFNFYIKRKINKKHKMSLEKLSKLTQINKTTLANIIKYVKEQINNIDDKLK